MSPNANRTHADTWLRASAMAMVAAADAVAGCQYDHAASDSVLDTLGSTDHQLTTDGLANVLFIIAGPRGCPR